VFLEEKEIRTQTHRGKTTQRHREEKTTIYRSKRETAEETNPANTLILDFQPPKL